MKWALLLRKIMVLTFCFCIFTQWVKAAGQENHWITQWPTDREHDHCLQKAQFTADMVYCHVKAAKEWNLILNKEYKLLYNSASPSARKSLKKSEIAWMHYRDSYLKFAGNYYLRDGTVYRSWVYLPELHLARAKSIALMIERENSQEQEPYSQHEQPAKKEWTAIYQWTENCLKEHLSISCYTKAGKKWDAVLNKQFKALYDAITDNDGYIGRNAATIKKELKNSQQLWIRYRDSYYQFLDDYYHQPGEQWSRAKARAKMRVVQYKATSLRKERENSCLTTECIESVK